MKTTCLVAFGLLISFIGHRLYLSKLDATPTKAVAEEPATQPDIPIGPTVQISFREVNRPWEIYEPSDAWFHGIIELETGGHLEARKENPCQILKPFWNEGAKYLGVDWDYLKNRHSVWKSKEIIKSYLAKYGVGNDCAAAMIFRRGPTGSGWRYWRALEPKLIDQELE